MATRRFDFKFHCTKDADIIQRLDAQENKQQYIRQLIATDIMADSLRGAFQIEDTRPDPDEIKESMRIDFYNENCPSVNNIDPDVDLCKGCKYMIPTDNYSEPYTCTIQSAWENYWKHEAKTKLNSVYGQMIKDPFKEDVINNIVECPDLSKYSDRLWKLAYERGKKEGRLENGKE